MANTVGTLNLLQSIVEHGLELEKFDTAGTSEEYGNVREAVAHHHDFDDEGGLVLHERSPINPKSVYATAKVAADFLTMNYHDAYGVPGDVIALRVGYEKLHRETGWETLVSWEEGLSRTIAWYAENRTRWVGRVDWQLTAGDRVAPS